MLILRGKKNVFGLPPVVVKIPEASASVGGDACISKVFNFRTGNIRFESKFTTLGNVLPTYFFSSRFLDS